MLIRYFGRELPTNYNNEENIQKKYIYSEFQKINIKINPYSLNHYFPLKQK